MRAIAALAAVLAFPAGGVSAGIQADPVCVPGYVEPGSSYPLTVYVTGTGTLAVTVVPDTREPAARLRQVPASWIEPSPAIVSPGPGAEVRLMLNVPPGAAPGPYWSDVQAVTQGQPQPGGGAQVSLGAGAATAIVFTAGGSGAPPPCAALDLAQSTGKFPPWPAKAYATTGWPQVFAPQERAERAAHAAPTAIPTAGSGGSPAPAAPAVAAAYKAPSKAPSNWPGWLVIIAIGLVVLRMLFRLLGGGK